MKNLSVLVLLTVLIAACSAPRKLTFNQPEKLDQQVTNSTTKELKCGDNFSAEFTNTDSTFGTLEVDNKGIKDKGCNVNVVVTNLTGGVAGAGTPVTKFAAGPGFGNIAVFPLAQNQKYGFRFECESSTTATGCTFSYRFSRAKEIAGNPSPSPTPPSSPTIDISTVMPPGPTTGNMCITDSQIAKVITNATKQEVIVLFTARSTCQCSQFIVSSDPPTSSKDRVAIAPPSGSSDGGVSLPAGKSVTLKAKCGGIGPTRDKCSGVVENFRLAIGK